MTDTTRLTKIETLLRVMLESASSTNEKDNASKELNSMNVTTKEWLTLAAKEQKLPADFDVTAMLKMPDDLWEDQQRKQKEEDDILSTIPEEKEEDHSCFTCGSQCVSYNIESETYWICENCYYGTNESSIGYCGFPCDGYCQTCGGGGYDGADEI
jgi:hypothetical protein